LNIHGYGDMRDTGYIDGEGNQQGGAYIGVLDQNGVSCHAVTDISDYAYNQWYTREFKLGDFLGTFTHLLVCQDTHVSDPALVSGAGTAYYKNICVKDADGNVVWSYTPTAADVAAATDLVATTPEYSMTCEATEGSFLYAPASELQYFEIVETEYVPSTTAPSTTVPATDAPATGEGNDAPTTEEKKEEGGCGGMMGIGALVLAAVLSAPVAFKKH
ncbi:MAG: hypothetical protein IJC15_08330, partial [Clostridia bacterium]|nr:hypothetical protein [Clostridia bacterium]